MPTGDGTASLAENGDVLSNHCNALHTFGHHDGNCLQGIFVKLDLPPSPSFENDTLTREFIIEHLFVRCKEYFRPLEKAAFFAALMIVCDSQIQLFTVLRLSRLHSLIPSSPPKYKYYGKNYDLLFLLNSSNILLSICMFKYSLRNASIS